MTMKKTLFALSTIGLCFPFFLFAYEGENDFDTYVIPYFSNRSGSIEELTTKISQSKSKKQQSAFQITDTLWLLFLARNTTPSLSPLQTPITKLTSPYQNENDSSQEETIQQICFPLWEHISFAGGTVDLTGYAMSPRYEAMQYSGEIKRLVAYRLYFVVKESSDPDFFSLPFVKQSFEMPPRPTQKMLKESPWLADIEEWEGFSGFILGCNAQWTESLRYLTQTVDLASNRYEISAGSFPKETSRTLLKSASGLRYDISIRITIDPNVFTTPIEYLPCNNPWITHIEILDASSVEIKQPACLVDRNGNCHPDWELIDSFMCDDEGWNISTVDYFWTEEEYERRSKDGRFYVDCSGGREYVGHLSYDTICCKGYPDFSSNTPSNKNLQNRLRP